MADTLDSLGFIHLHLGDVEQAKVYYQQAIDAYREIGAPYGEGNSMAGLGDVVLHEGRPDQARALYLRAAAILDTLPHPRADEIRLKLRDLDEDPEADPLAADDHVVSDPSPGARHPDRDPSPGAATTAR